MVEEAGAGTVIMRGKGCRSKEGVLEGRGGVLL